jgi:hypothetical protein
MVNSSTMMDNYSFSMTNTIVMSEEKRNFITKTEPEKKPEVPNEKKPLMVLSDDFYSVYGVSKEDVGVNPKIEYRFFCFQHIKYMRNIELPPIKKGMMLEAVLIEFRPFPHLEFLIRNTIRKLGPEWSHTVVCGKLNYEFVKNMCHDINVNIKVIQTKYENLNPSEYSRFLSSLSFWNLFDGKKILIYQEDTCIFRTNIRDFLRYDYVGAPWPLGQNDNKNLVGNGGFSLRTKQCMIDVIQKVSIDKTNYNSCTLEYLKNTKSTVPPEDVYFSKNMLDYNIGLVADWSTASHFSCETIYNPKSLGGHNFWLSNKEWKKTMRENVVLQVRPNYDDFLVNIEHRGGWRYVLDSLCYKDFFNTEASIEFYDVADFATDKIKNHAAKGGKWAGIFHLTPKTPAHLDFLNIQTILKDDELVASMRHCLFLVSVSQYFTDFMTRFLASKYITHVKIYTIKHPVVNTGFPCFDWELYKNNPEKKVIQVGQQMRKLTSIYTSPIPHEYKRLWLTGFKDQQRSKDALLQEINSLRIHPIKLDDVEMYYTKTFEEYDTLLSKNIVLVELFDATANNSVLECIIRNTPILVNKVGGVSEYLGDNYPLYFTNQSEIPFLLQEHKLKEAHEYLKQMPKEEFDIHYFIKKMFQVLQTL